MKMKMSVSVRLMIGFGILCLFLMGVGLFALQTMNKVNVTTHQIIQNWMPSVTKAYQMKLAVTQFQELEGEFIAQPDNPDTEKEMSELNANLQQYVKDYLQSSLSKDGKDIANTFSMDFEAYQAMHGNIIDFAKKGQQKGALLIYNDQSARLFADIHDGLDKLIKISVREAELTGINNQKQYDQGFKIIIITIVLILLVSVILSLWTTRSILRPLRKINEILQDLANSKGDLTRRVAINTGDEIQQVGQNVNKVLDTVENMVVKIRASTENLANSSDKIRDHCSQLSLATEEISNAITQLSEKAVVQTERTQSTQGMIEEYLRNLQDVTAYAQQTFDLAYNANESAEKGNIQIAEVLQTIADIKEQNKVTNESLQYLHQSLAKIEGINHMIKKISEQTNMLSLNAGIEAARAGVAGKGFSVVAGEVRKLSNETKSSSETIVNLLGEIQREVDHVHDQFHHHTGKIAAGSEQIEQMLTTLHEMKDVNTTVMTNGEKTKTEAGRMLQTVQQIVDVFHTIGLLSTEQSATSEEVSASAEEQLSSTHVILALTRGLSEQAADLKKLVEQFHVQN